MKQDADPIAMPASEDRLARRMMWNKVTCGFFLDRLAESSCVKWACDKVGLSLSGLYAYRRKHPDFARQWDEALEAGYALLEAELLDRARNGETTEVTDKKTGEVTVVKSFSSTLGVALLRLHADRVAKVRALRGDVVPVPDLKTLLPKLRKRAETLLSPAHDCKASPNG